MRVLLVGAGGVGSSIVRIAARRKFFELMVVADYDQERARRAAAAAADYLDMAMSLSRPHPEEPFSLPGVKLGDQQFAEAEAWVERGRLALVGIGVEPGMSDVFARYAADELFDRIDEIGVRDGADLVVEGYAFAPTFSIWTTIEECLNPPVVYERERGWYTTEPFSEPELFDFPDGIGQVECVNVEHEEVLLIPRWIEAGRVTFKYGLGQEFIDVLATLHKLGLDSTRPVRVGAVEVAPREVYLYQVADNQATMRDWGAQAVVWQTAVNPVAALELLEGGAWSGAGVLGPEAFDARPFLGLLPDYGATWRLREQPPSSRQT